MRRRAGSSERLLSALCLVLVFALAKIAYAQDCLPGKYGRMSDISLFQRVVRPEWLASSRDSIYCAWHHSRAAAAAGCGLLGSEAAKAAG